jgi:putative tricarboxylic transport membrane protein
MVRATPWFVALTLVAGFSQRADAAPAHEHLRLIAPAAPGGGWDQTARVMQQVLQANGLVRTSSVENIAGAAGTIGLARLVSADRGNPDVAMVSGLIMLAAVVTHRSPLTLHDVTPIARLIGEYEAIVVPVSSPFRTLPDLIQAFKQHPESISWGGGSAGGTDQILAGLVADAVGVSPRRVNYIAFSGGGESMAAILGGQVTAGINGLAEFAPHIAAGTVRVLGISSAARLPGVAAPTLREQGIDIELENWRSVVAAPAIGAAGKRRLEATVAAMVRSKEWRSALERFRWNDRYLAGDAFVRFQLAEEARVQAILRKLGTGEAPSSSAGWYPLLVVVGLAACLAAALLQASGQPRAPEASPRHEAWRASGFVAAAIALDLLLLETGGFVMASALLFWFTARAFDAGHPVRDAAFALGISVAAYVLFARVLQLPLPTGPFPGGL